MKTPEFFNDHAMKHRTGLLCHVILTAAHLGELLLTGLITAHNDSGDHFIEVEHFLEYITNDEAYYPDWMSKMIRGADAKNISYILAHQ